MRPGHRLAAAALVLLTAAAVALPWPADRVEALYAGRWYPALQALLSTQSNRLPFPLFDLGLLAGLLLIGARVATSIVATRRHGRSAWRATPHVLWHLTVMTGAAYLWFVIAWGGNYARPSVEARLGLSAAPVQPAEISRLLDAIVRACNREVDAAHRVGFPGAHDVPPALIAALHAVERDRGRVRPTVPSRPKATWLGPWFQAAGIDGMLAPLALETLVAPDLTPPERPFVLAHEWAHLSGEAPEAEASFMAWQVTERADAPARYSAALALFAETAAQVPQAERIRALEALALPVRQDLAAVAARAAARSAVARQVAWRTYDGYLRAQGVDDGVQSYSRVVSLVIRAGAWPRG